MRSSAFIRVHLITPNGVVLAGGRASLYVLDLIGWRKLAAVLSIIPLLWIVDAGYWVVARNRRWFSRWLFRRHEQV